MERHLDQPNCKKLHQILISDILLNAELNAGLTLNSDSTGIRMVSGEHKTFLAIGNICTIYYIEYRICNFKLKTPCADLISLMVTNCTTMISGVLLNAQAALTLSSDSTGIRMVSGEDNTFISYYLLQKGK